MLTKQVTTYGNGAHVVVPKALLGLKVVVRPLSLKETILNILDKNLKYVRGIYLYGSYARGDYDALSDIDILIIVRNGYRNKIKWVVEKLESYDKRLNIEVLSKIEDNLLLIKNAIEECEIILDKNRTYEKIKKVKVSNRVIKEELKEMELYMELDIRKNIYDVCYVLYSIYRVLEYISKILKVKIKKVDKIDLIRDVYRKEKIGIRLKPIINIEDLKEIKKVIKENLEILKWELKRK